jgi:hypothetical protein
MLRFKKKVIFLLIAICFIFLLNVQFLPNIENFTLTVVSTVASPNESSNFDPFCKCHKYSLKLEQIGTKCQIKKVENTTESVLYQIDFAQLQNVLFSCDYFHSLRRGIGQRVVSFSLYGRNPKYQKNILKLASQIERYYPNWLMRIYYDKSIDQDLICEFECSSDRIEFCNVSQMYTRLANEKQLNVDFDKYFGMYWRWLPIGDHFVDYFMSRDLDADITEREYQAVKVWLNSNTLFHIMRGKYLNKLSNCLS